MQKVNRGKLRAIEKQITSKNISSSLFLFQVSRLCWQWQQYRRVSEAHCHGSVTWRQSTSISWCALSLCSRHCWNTRRSITRIGAPGRRRRPRRKTPTRRKWFLPRPVKSESISMRNFSFQVLLFVNWLYFRKQSQFALSRLHGRGYYRAPGSQDVTVAEHQKQIGLGQRLVDTGSW